VNNEGLHMLDFSLRDFFGTNLLDPFGLGFYIGSSGQIKKVTHAEP
jgi:hypothetical protein